MKIKVLIAFALPFLLPSMGLGQGNIRKAKPSVSQVDLMSYFADIQWNDGQREYLDGSFCELVLRIDEKGNPTIDENQEVYFDDQGVTDSLRSRVAILPPFIPRNEAGTNVSTRYRLLIHYPKEGSQIELAGFSRPVPFHAMSEFEYEKIEISNRAWALWYAPYVNTFEGSISNHFATGGGIKMMMGYTFSTATTLAGGLNLNVNRVTEEIFASDGHDRHRAPACLGFNFALDQRIGRFHLSAEGLFQYIPVTKTRELEDEDIDGTTYRGFAPGLFLSYAFNVFKKGEEPYFTLTNMMSIATTIQPYFGYREMQMNFSDLRGGMWEFGVIFRMDNRYVDSYKVNPSSLRRR